MHDKCIESKPDMFNELTGTCHQQWLQCKSNNTIADSWDTKGIDPITIINCWSSDSKWGSQGRACNNDQGMINKHYLITLSHNNTNIESGCSSISFLFPAEYKTSSAAHEQSKLIDKATHTQQPFSLGSLDTHLKTVDPNPTSYLLNLKPEISTLNPKSFHLDLKMLITWTFVANFQSQVNYSLMAEPFKTKEVRESKSKRPRFIYDHQLHN